MLVVAHLRHHSPLLRSVLDTITELERKALSPEPLLATFWPHLRKIACNPIQLGPGPA